MVTIKALGETQDKTGDACGAFCLAAIASGMGIIPISGQKNTTKTIEYKPNNLKIQGTLHMDQAANEIAKEIYQITGNLKNPTTGVYEFTDKPDKKNKNADDFANQNSLEQKHQKPKLTARWKRVDGKLICQWIIE